MSDSRSASVEKQYDVFLSHAGYDGGQKLEASNLYEILVEKGNLKVFYDRKSLEPGKRTAVLAYCLCSGNSKGSGCYTKS